MLRPEFTCRTEPEGLEIDATEIAPLLGLTPEQLMAELRAGTVHHSAEELGGNDVGRICVTFRYRARMARLIVGPDGSMHPGPGQNH